MGVLGQTRDQGAASVTPTASAVADKTGFFENVGAGFRQAVAGVHSTQVGQAIYEKRAYDEIIKALAAEGEQGEDTLTITATPTKVKRPFRNPYVSGPWENLLNPSHNFITDLYGGGDRAEAQQIWGALQRVRQRKPDFLKGYSDEAALHALTEKRRQQDQAAAQVITSRAGTMGTVGQFVGGMGGSVASLDPENAVGAGFGTAAGKTVARTVIKRSMEGAAVNAAASAVALPGQIADAQRLGQEFTSEDALHQIGEGAAIGAVFGGAHVIIPKVAGAAGKVAGAVADKVTSAPPVRDALIAASIRAGTINDHSVLNEWMRTHNPGGIVDTTTPDERAAAHTILRDAANRETSPLHPQHAGENDGRLDAVAHALGVDMSTPDLPSAAPIQAGTVRDREAGGRRPVAYEEAVHAAEGTGKNPDSSADGHFQFTEGTWLDYAPRVTDTKGKSRAEILALRHDLPTARKAEQLFRADNGRYLRERGLEDSPGNLSLAHFLGPSDAAKTLKADPAAPIESIIDPRSFRSNRKLLEGKSAAEVVAWAHKRIGAAVDLPVARADAVPDADGLDAADYSDTPYERATFTPDDIETDAALMQYKSGGDDEGITGKLKDVTAWDPLMSSEILVWEGGDGRRVVVDGHQRVGLAKRLSTESEPIELPALVVREADGITAAQARVLGALRNINLGTGSLIDNARVLRDAPQAAELLKGAENRREIAGLARLSYEAFGAAINGVIDPRIAAEIGQHALDPSTHMALAGMLAKENVRDPREASVIIRQALADGFGSPRETQMRLFGAEPQQSLYVPIARILAAASKKLREEKRTFRVLSEKAGRIEEAGNVLDRTANEERVMSSDEALAIIERTAHSAGPVRDALIAAARTELSGSRRSDAVNGFLDALAGIDLRAAAAGASENGTLGQPLGEAGIRDAAAETDRLLSDRNEPSLLDHAITARAASEPFSDPVGEAAKAETELLEHDLRAMVSERRDAAGASPTKLAETQGQATPEELHAMALANQPELARVSAEIASETGATVENPGVKSLSRIQEKVDLEGYDHAGQIKDATRIAFVVQSPEQAATVAERIRGAYPEHADKGIQTLPANGYTDHKIIVRFANGAVGEVQIIPDVIYTEKFKKGLGKLYREARSSADRAEQERLNGLQREGYAAALAGSAFRDWSMNEKSASGNSLRALASESGVPSVEDLPTSAGASRQPDDGFQANARPDLGSDQSTATSRSSTSNNSMLMGETSSPDIGNTTEIVNEADPNIANRQRQEAQLKAASPMRSIAEQQGTMGLGLFDVADEPTFRLSEADDDGKPLSEIMRDAEEDEVAAKALRDCLKPGEGA